MKHLRIIKNSGILLFILLAQLVVHAESNAQPDSNAIIKIIPSNKNQYILRQHTLSLKKKNQTILLARIERAIHDAVLFKDVIWIGTAKGLYSYSIKTNQVLYQTMLGSDLSINCLKIDKQGVLWIASMNDGLWKVIGNKAEKVLDISPVYSLETPADSTIWAGTNIGLYKWNKQTNKWLRYAEEGYSGYEIPDNIVEKLFCDLNNNVWVIMPDEFAFISSHSAEDHIQDFRNMVAQDFELKYVAEPIPYQYIFVTSKGFFLMSNSPIEYDQGNNEIKNNTNKNMYLLTNKQLLLSNEIHPVNISSVNTDRKNNLLIAFGNQVYCIKKKTLKRAIKNVQAAIN